ncbi:hypothetical protein B0T22DRAFT_301992 [Podospora appendiculata]|uniref:Transcription factor hoxa13 n=1 Tax=Podospora appendiculata TaxID=314037 RepID=A0AAE0X0G0_9PEZI|nr:hypothetical protein B0T22DRAFT_301992 [Podospora appendiculata]
MALNTSRTMGAQNGALKGPKAVNGVNGNTLKASLNGHAVGPRKRAIPAGPGLFAWSLNVLGRLLTWYSILTILLRCPATLDACDESSPRICRPYFQLKHAVAPHLEPYYTTYAAPYVDVVRPYYDTVDRTVIVPGLGYAKKYGAPQVEQARAYSKAQWEKSVQPQLVKYQTLAKTQYDQSLAPHVDRVSTAIGPYYEIARTNALQTYHELFLPSYQFIRPYAQQGYQSASTFTTGTAVPSALWAWNKTYVFLDGTVWPHLRVIYVENVEPQLVKIGQRLGRHNSGKKMVPKSFTDASASSAIKTTASSFIKPTLSVSASATTSTSSYVTPSASVAKDEEPQAAAESSKTRSTAEQVSPPDVDEALESDDPVRRTARETVAADLEDWQERYAKAADEGAAEIDERVQEISKRMIRRNARIMGKSLLDQLRSSAVSELVTLRRDILRIAGAVKQETATVEEGEEQITQVVRRAGLAIKEKAQDVRTWRENYEAEMHAAITKAAETHFSILENIRDLALQKIGMKWAWMDGVTYKDWAKYHLLKSRFEEWKGDLENLIVTHSSLEAAQLEGANIEEEAMKMAASAAKELARLKQVAGWKLAARDDTPEFDSTLMQQAAEAATAAAQAAARIVENIVESASDAKDAIYEKVGEGAGIAAEAINKATSAVVDAQDTAVSQGEEVVESATEAASSQVSSSISAGQESASSLQETVIASVVSATSQVSEAVSAAPESAFSATESTQSEEAAPDLAFTVILAETPVVAGNTSEFEPDSPAPVQLPIGEELGEPQLEESDIVAPIEDRPATSITSIKSAWLGAAAQSVPSRMPILDEDEDDVSNAMASLREDFKSAYSAAISRANDQYAQALSVVSVQIHGTPKPAHEQLLASVTSGYINAMATASSRLDEALNAASSRLYGTPTTTNIIPTAVSLPSLPTVDWAEWARVESIAAERLQQGRAWAEEQYESAKIAIGLATPAPSTPAEHVNKMLENAKHNYYAGLGVAYARYSDFLATASSALSSVTATPTPTDLAGSASSAASVASASAWSVASAASASAASIAGAAGDAGADLTSSAWSAASAAGASASSVASVASESAASVASAAAAAGTDLASSASSVASVVNASAVSVVSVVGENVSSAAAAGYESAASVAGAGYDNAAAAASKVSDSWDVVVTRISIQIYGEPTPTPWYASAYSLASEYVSSASDAAGEYAASATDAAGNNAAAVSDEASRQYEAVSVLVSELLYGKEPTFSESVLSRLSAAYATGASSASSFASAAQATAASAAAEASEAAQSVGEKIVSAASEATKAVKDEL